MPSQNCRVMAQKNMIDWQDKYDFSQRVNISKNLIDDIVA